MGGALLVVLFAWRSARGATERERPGRALQDVPNNLDIISWTEEAIASSKQQ